MRENGAGSSPLPFLTPLPRAVLSSLRLWCPSQVVGSFSAVVVVVSVPDRGWGWAEGPRDTERERVTRRRALYEAIGVPVKLRRSLRRLSSSPWACSPKCLFSLALFPVLSFSEGKLGERGVLRRFQTGTVGAAENEKMSPEGRPKGVGGRGGGAPPASYAPVSGRTWQLSCQREVVATWRRSGKKKGPL